MHTWYWPTVFSASDVFTAMSDVLDNTIYMSRSARTEELNHVASEAASRSLLH